MEGKSLTVKMDKTFGLSVFLIYFLNYGLCERERPYVGHKVVRIGAENYTALQEITKRVQNLDVIHVDGHHHSLHAIVESNDLDKVIESIPKGAVLDILVQDLQREVDGIFSDLDRQHSKRSTVNLQDSTLTYLNLNEMYAFQDELVSECGHSVDIVKKTIGHSYEKNTINLLQISKSNSSADKNTIFIEAGIHAREWLSHSTANHIMYQLACNKDNSDLLELFNWEILPVLNPDGYAYTHSGKRLWRKNRQPNEGTTCYGTDINRNFETGFGGEGSSNNPCSSTYHGGRAYSSPEARALHDSIMGKEEHIAAYLSLHTFGQLILLPWAYTDEKPEDLQSLMELADTVEEAIGLPFRKGPAYTTIYPASGVSTDFTRDVAGIRRSFTWELMPSHHKQSLGFVPTVQDAARYIPLVWNGVRAFAEAVAEQIRVQGADDFNQTPFTPSPEIDGHGSIIAHTGSEVPDKLNRTHEIIPEHNGSIHLNTEHAKVSPEHDGHGSIHLNTEHAKVSPEHDAHGSINTDHAKVEHVNVDHSLSPGQDIHGLITVQADTATTGSGILNQSQTISPVDDKHGWINVDTESTHLQQTYPRKFSQHWITIITNALKRLE